MAKQIFSNVKKGDGGSDIEPQMPRRHEHKGGPLTIPHHPLMVLVHQTMREMTLRNQMSMREREMRNQEMMNQAMKKKEMRRQMSVR